MKTMAEAYCAVHGCTRAQCQARLFWRSLYPAAWFWLPLLGGRNGRHFAADRELITDIVNACTMAQVRDAVRDFYLHPARHRLLRRAWHVRVSTRKLRLLAHDYLPDFSPDDEGRPKAGE